MEKEKLPKYISITPIGISGRKNIKKYKGEFKHKNTIYYCGTYETIREAQIAVDIKRISLKLNPILLKPK